MSFFSACVSVIRGLKQTDRGRLRKFDVLHSAPCCKRKWKEVFEKRRVPGDFWQGQGGEARASRAFSN